ncbi:M14 family metallopeptidase [Caenimonas terrae]|uniref:M14 family metallopeptidase n=1 Tax=Caenimonas terrae TaxID=696074 RepID=A0ABW0NMT1_9BURK
MSAAAQAFAASYAEARRKFLDAAAGAGLAVESKPHPLKGIDGEPLAMDVARDGPADAAALLILSSACHGVEGFCGSGVQVAALRDARWREHAKAQGVAVLYIHGLNPYGFSHLRRTTHENVDLNRNFHDFSLPLPANEAYREVQELLLPREWPPGAANNAELASFVRSRGEAAYQAAVSRGQHDFPDGLFYGGTEASWSNKAVREVLRAHGRRAARIAWIDIHTGLGAPGVGERIYAARDDAATLERARRWWNGDGKTPVTSIYDGSSTSSFLTGMMFQAAYEECPQAQYTGMAMEYGTVPVMQTLHSLRAEQWLQRNPQAAPALVAQIRGQVREAFYTDTDAWKEQVVAQAREALVQAADGLGAPVTA